MADDPEFRLAFRRESAAADATVYRVEATGAAGPRRAGTFTLPFSPVELENYILRFSRTRRTVRRIDSPEMTAARKFGGALFQALMTDDVGDGYRVAQGIASGARQNLRISISLTEAPELAAIPWEFLYDERSFLAMSKRTPVVRCLDVEGPARPFEMTLPLRILAVESQPKGVPVLATGAERGLLTSALSSVANTGAVQCDWLEEATLGALNQRLRGGQYHILHFIGHGTFDEAHKEGALAFEDQDGNLDVVGGDRLATIVGPRESLRLVVLNSCEGARSDVSDPFSGVAGRLIGQDVPAVIGMQFEITDRAAILFAREFYTVLAEGQPVDTAMSEARLAILADQNDVEWATPALFIRGSDARLFSITDAVPIVRVEPALPDPLGAPADPGGDQAPDDGGREPPGDGTGSVGDSPDTGPTSPQAGVVRVTPPLTLTGRTRAWFRARPLTLPLVLAAVGILAVALVAAVVLAPAGKASLHAESSPARPDQMLVTGSGFQEGETVDVVLDGGTVTSTPQVRPGGQFDTTFSRPTSIPVGRTVEIVATGRDSHKSALALEEFGGVVLPTPSAPGPPSPTTSPVSPTGFACRPPGTANPSVLFFSDYDAAEVKLTDGSRLLCIDVDTGAIGTIPGQSALVGRTVSASTWAPDSGDIAFTHRATNDSNSDRDIDILKADGGLEPLVDDGNDDFFPAWSAKDVIAFVRAGAGRVTDPGANSRIMLVRRGGSPVGLIEGIDLRAPVWSRDGTQLAFFGRQTATAKYDIGRIDFRTAPVDPASIDLAAIEVIWAGSELANELNPSFTSDGTRLVFVSDSAGKLGSGNDIWAGPLDLAGAVALTGPGTEGGEGVQDGNPGWSPDGSQVVFYRARRNGFHLWVMGKDGRGQDDLMRGRPGQSMDPSWR